MGDALEDTAGQPGARFAGRDLYQQLNERVTGGLEGLLLQPGWRNLLLERFRAA